MKSFFFNILNALFGWQHAEKPLCDNADGQPLAVPPPRQKDIETVFIHVNDSKPFPLGLESAINYFELVVFGKKPTKVLALAPGGGAVVSEITNSRELRNFLGQGLMIKMIG